jgi:predicted O-methyltransferase YrrM
MVFKIIKSKLTQIIIFLKYRNNPFGNKPLGTKEEYLSLFNQIKDKKYEIIDQIEKETGYKIDKRWLDDLALQTQIVKKKNLLNYQHGRLIYSILRKYLKDKNKSNKINILETGTARGFSSICMAKALLDSNFYGLINTIDIIPNNKKIFWNCISDTSGKKTRLELLANWKDELRYVNFLEGLTSYVLNKNNFKRIHFAFLDAQHDKESVMREYNYVNQRQKAGDIIIFDDVSKNFKEIKLAIENIKNQNLYNIEILEFSNESRGYAIAKKI